MEELIRAFLDDLAQGEQIHFHCVGTTYDTNTNRFSYICNYTIGEQEVTDANVIARAEDWLAARTPSTIAAYDLASSALRMAFQN
jgi:hypothetical protein